MFVVGQKVVNGVGEKGIVIAISNPGMIAFPMAVDYGTRIEHYPPDGKYYGYDCPPSEFDLVV